jgi:alpha-mannosidase
MSKDACMSKDWTEVLQRKIAKLTAYRTAQTWLCCRTSGNNALREHASQAQGTWKPVDFPSELTERATYWLKTTYAVPEEVEGLPVAGSRVVLQSRTLKPMEVSVDGRSIFHARFWTDLCTPEVVLTDQAVPGQHNEILVRVDNPGTNGINDRIEIAIEIESVEDAIFELETFVHEIPFCENVTRVLAREALPLFEEAVQITEREIGDEEPPAALIATIKRIRTVLEPLAEQTKKLTVHLIGHAHIDMNWLWTMEDTIDVCRRDFDTMTRFMEEFPDFCFSQSQAAVYDLTQRSFPEIFERILPYVETGRWEVTAATWTEGDLNMSSGESIVRHILFSKRYCEQKLCSSSRIGWEPDTFGHPASIPQILKKCGIPYYYHMRVGRSEPLYVWEGPDGSEVLVFNSVYNNRVNAADITKLPTVLLEKHELRHTLFVYGVGDHGGGATRRDIRRARALGSLPTMPRVIFSTATAFFDAVASADLTTLPRVRGELNPIFDGCYTSHADLKRLMRGSENRLLELEVSGVLAELYDPGQGGSFDPGQGGSCDPGQGGSCDPGQGGSFDTSREESLWRTVLFNQFHDILCGCAIHSTYELAESELQEVLDRCARLIRENLSSVSVRIRPRKPPGRTFVLWNLQGHTRTDITSMDKPVEWSEIAVIDSEGKRLASQILDGRVYFVAEDVPPFGFRAYSFIPVPEGEPESHRGSYATIQDGADTLWLESDFYRMAIRRDSGCIVWLVDKENGRAFVSERNWIERKSNLNNLFSVEYEIPHRLSAWLIGPIARIENLVRGARVDVESTGPVMDVLSIEHKLGKSTIAERLFFYKSLKRIDFQAVVDWQEVSSPIKDAPLLRVSFRPELSGVIQARYDIPFGVIEREADGTEYPAQKWVDISDGEAGMSLINDGRYGFRCNGTTLSMTCIRTSYAPDPEPDRGKHVFGYALYPHRGDPVSGGTPYEAAGFNSPLIPILLAEQENQDDPGSAWLEEEISLLTLQVDGVVVSSVKRAAVGKGIVLRLYEAGGRKTEFRVQTALKLETVEEISPTEDRTLRVLSTVRRAESRAARRKSSSTSCYFSDSIGRYEIKTYRLIGELFQSQIK